MAEDTITFRPIASQFGANTKLAEASPTTVEDVLYGRVRNLIEQNHKLVGQITQIVNTILMTPRAVLDRPAAEIRELAQLL